MILQADCYWNFSEGIIWLNFVAIVFNFRGESRWKNTISYSTPRMSIEGDLHYGNHFQLAQCTVKSHKGDYGGIIVDLASESNEKKIYNNAF